MSGAFSAASSAALFVAQVATLAGMIMIDAGEGLTLHSHRFLWSPPAESTLFTPALWCLATGGAAVLFSILASIASFAAGCTSESKPWRQQVN